MKGEYVEEENEPNKETTSRSTNPHHPHPHPHNMFAKFSPHPFHPHHLQPHQPPPPQHHFPPPHLHSHPPFSEEADSPTPPHHLFQQQSTSSKKPKITPPSQTQTQTTTTSNEDHGGTIEVSRRPRGRPPGSKNKPKPPIVITRDPEPAMSPYILELPSGADVVDSLTRFTRRRSLGLCVLTASGAVANVTLKQPSTTTPGGTVTFHGRFDILSLSAVVGAGNTTPYNGNGGGFTISLAGPQGQIVGGKVVGSLVCSGTVYVIAASFNNPSYCRLPLDDTTTTNTNIQQQHDTPPPDHSGGGGGGAGNDQGNSPVSGGGGTMSLYSGHLGSAAAATTSGGSGDVIWANPSSGRQPYMNE